MSDVDLVAVVTRTTHQLHCLSDEHVSNVIPRKLQQPICLVVHLGGTSSSCKVHQQLQAGTTWAAIVTTSHVAMHVSRMVRAGWWMVVAVFDAAAAMHSDDDTVPCRSCG
jgi:hypothetical protein